MTKTKYIISQSIAAFGLLLAIIFLKDLAVMIFLSSVLCIVIVTTILNIRDFEKVKPKLNRWDWSKLGNRNEKENEFKRK